MGGTERFSQTELRLIFLHELGHIKRGDLAVNWLAAGLQAAHWFNPVLWLAWRRMRADRELATDALALALAQAGEGERIAYGETILKVAAGLRGERVMPGLVGIGESKAQLKERLRAIARPGTSWKPAAVMAAALVAAAGLTDAQTKKPTAKAVAAPAENDSGPTLTGTVCGPDGKPAPMAQVGLTQPNRILLFSRGSLGSGAPDDNLVRANERGGFSLPMSDTVEELYAADEEGYAILPREGLTNGMRVRLEPWARVEGTMRLNHEAAARQEIELVQDGGHYLAGRVFQERAETDSAGHFRFDKVPSGYYSLSRLLMVPNNMWSVNATFLSATPGKTTEIAWGGGGRPVKGRFLNMYTNPMPKDAVYSVRLQTPWPRPPALSGREYWSWRKSEAGMAAFDKYRGYGAYAAADWSFEVDDVEPGTYELIFSGSGPSEHPAGTMFLNTPTKVVTIPPLSDPDKCEAFDLGDIETGYTCSFSKAGGEWPPPLEVGAEEPDIQGRTLSGQPLRLKDYRGKYVLLDLSAMFPGPETEELESVAKAHASDERLVILSFCLDVNERVAKQLEQTSGRRWQRGFIDRKTAEEEGLFGIHETPAVLIDPQGKIKAHVALGSMQATVAAALE